MNDRFTVRDATADDIGLIVDMRKQVLRHRKDTLQSTHGAQRTLDGHQKILLALQLKDPELCEKTMREHIKLAKEDALLALLREDK